MSKYTAYSKEVFFYCIKSVTVTPKNLNSGAGETWFNFNLIKRCLTLSLVLTLAHGQNCTNPILELMTVVW